jgi:hypothetical protein
MNFSHLLLCCGLLAVLPGVHAKEIVCPHQLQATETAEPVSGWQAQTDLGKRGRFLDGISVYSGNPEEMANLVPDSSLVRKGERISTWKLRADEHGYWMACRYTNSLTLLTRPLAPRFSRCELREKLLPSRARLSIGGFSCE